MVTNKRTTMIDSLEKIPVKIFPDSQQGSLYIAQQIAQLIKEKETAGQKCY
jgi:glucosamine-6-phosphate deaminase